MGVRRAVQDCVRVLKRLLIVLDKKGTKDSRVLLETEAHVAQRG
jgi:hypothetical protein